MNLFVTMKGRSRIENCKTLQERPTWREDGRLGCYGSYGSYARAPECDVQHRTGGGCRGGGPACGASCLLEQRGPACYRPLRPWRRIRHRELREQVPRRGGDLHGHRPRSDLRHRAGVRGWLPALCDQPHRPARRVGPGGHRNGGTPHARRYAARAWFDARPTGDSRWALRQLPRRHPRRRHVEDGRDRCRWARLPRRCSRCARTTDGRATPSTVSLRSCHPLQAPVSGIQGALRWLVCACPVFGRSRSAAPRNSGRMVLPA